MLSRTRYAKSGDLHIAYRVGGEGPIDLVFAPGFISHLEWFEEEPSVNHFIERLTSFSRLIVFDKRGTGLSDPVSAPASLEERMDDVRAVMDAAGSPRAAIIGMSEGGPMAALFAATYPERASSLVLYGSYARILWAPDYPFGVPQEQLDKFSELLDRWGDGVGLSAWAPSVAKDPRFRKWWAQLQRVSASPGMIRSLFKLYPEIEVRAVLAAVHVPTLVVHRAGDRLIPAENGRYLAEHIAGAKYVELPGSDHIYFVGDADSIVDEFEEFLTGVRHGPDRGRALLTLLFTDIVRSSEHAERLGDKAWRELLDRHHALIRRQLLRFGGREVDTAGDGFFATFDGPARAVRCGQTIRDAVRALGIEIRAGVHTGECERVADEVRGIAVHVAARVAAAAEAGEILVSSTVKDLVAGSGLRFFDRGLCALKGIQGEWRLYAVQGERT
jgi:pimeloyl-ACP methyl ester carboxylesterase/class 3 adenylate cyclase